MESPSARRSIGSLLTHPDVRGRGYARALLRDAEAYLAQSGYDLGMLFTIIGTSFYTKLDWVPIPLPTFVLDLEQYGETPSHWKVIEQNGQLVGYLNYAVNANALEVREACFSPGNSQACNELALILLAETRQKSLQTIKSSLPIGHSRIERLCELSDALPHWGQLRKNHGQSTQLAKSDG